jgi:hypothetical protein
MVSSETVFHAAVDFMLIICQLSGEVNSPPRRFFCAAQPHPEGAAASGPAERS